MSTRRALQEIWVTELLWFDGILSTAKLH